MDIIIYTLVLAHISMMCSTVYIHRGVTHKSLIFHPILEHVLRFLTFVLDGADVQGWCTSHRIHHRYTDIHGDPHSPHVQGYREVCLSNFIQSLYLRYKNTWEPEWTRTYGSGNPEDWIELHIYRPYHQYGVLILLVINLFLWGWLGFISWLVIIAWPPLFNNTFANGIGHSWGYRNYDCKDRTTNFLPIGLFMCGEELHNNHHGDPANAKLSRRWWEFDPGWAWIKLFEFLGLLTIVDRKK